MKKIVSLMVFTLLFLGLNIAFADETNHGVDYWEQQLGDALAEFSYPNLSRAAMAARELGKIGSPRAIQVLIEGLKTAWDKWPLDYKWSVEKIKEVSDPISYALTTALVNLDKQNPSELDKLMPVLIDLFKNTKSVPNQQGFENLKDYPVSLAAMDSLIEIAKQNIERRDGIVNIFIDAIKNDNGYTKRYAAYALGELGVSEAVPYLLEALKKGTSWIIRHNAIVALGKIASPDPDVADSLIKILEDTSESPFIRTDAIISLGQIGVQNPGEVDKIASALIGVLGDKSKFSILKSVSERAIEALGKIGSPAVPYLIQEFKENEDQDVRKEIVQILGKIGDKVAIPVLTDAVKNDADPYVRSYSVEALTNIAIQHPDVAKEVVPTLIGLLGDKGGLSFYLSIGAMARDALVKIAKQDISVVVEPLQDFIRNGKGGEQAVKFAKSILTTLDADIPGPTGTGMLIPPQKEESESPNLYYGIIGSEKYDFGFM